VYAVSAHSIHSQFFQGWQHQMLVCYGISQTIIAFTLNGHNDVQRLFLIRQCQSSTINTENTSLLLYSTTSPSHAFYTQQNRTRTNQKNESI